MQVTRQRGRGGGLFALLALVLEPELLGTAVLAPTLREIVVAEDQGSMGAARLD